MDRPRHKRKAPRRTGPIRNAGEAWRGGGFRRDPGEPRDDAASSGVREGYRVIEEQIRRGRRMAEELDDEPWIDDLHDRQRRRRHRYPEEPRPGYGEEPWSRSGGGGFGLLGMPLRHMERLAKEILRQIVSVRPDPWKLIELIVRLQIEAIAELARLGFGALGMMTPRRGGSFAEDTAAIDREIDESFADIEDEVADFDEDFEDDDRDTWEWLAAPSAPAVIRAKVPIPVHVSSHEQTEIDLDLPAGSQSLELEVEPPLATGTGHPAPPAFEAWFVSLVDGPVLLRIEVPRDLPAGRYRRRILVRATGEPVGDLTVQVGTIPEARPEVSPESTPKAKPQARKKK